MREKRATLTSEKQLLGGTEETVLRLGVGNRIETSHTHDLSYGVSAAVVGIRVGAQDAAEIGLEPQIIGSLALLSPLIYAVALDGSGDGDVDAHVESREGIVATIESFDDLVGGSLAVIFVGEGVYIGSQAGGGGGIYACDMVINARLSAGVSEVLLQEMDEVWGTEFT